MIESTPAADASPAPAPQEAADARGCAVKLPVFEGPLDLLLHLIRSNEVDVANIPIAEISAQYLDYLELMRLVDIDVAAEYLVMAATLAHIKSRMLLPRDEEDDEEVEDPRAELARRLAEYARFQEAARELGARPLLHRDVFSGRVDPESVPEPEGELVVSLFALLESLQRALSKVPRDATHHAVELERVTLQDRMLHVMDLLSNAPDRVVAFEELLRDAATTRHRVVMTFLAILELARIQALKLFQNRSETGELFGPVRVRLAVDPDDADSARAIGAIEEPNG